MRTAVLIADCAILHTIIVPQIQIISIVFYEFGKFFNILTLYTSLRTLLCVENRGCEAYCAAFCAQRGVCKSCTVVACP